MDNAAAPLTDMLEDIAGKLPPAPADYLLFSGVQHDCTPRALLFDLRLTPGERNAWQLLRLFLDQREPTPVPLYERLSPLVSSVPCGARASHETISRMLVTLRLTRWLSLIRRLRDKKTGRLRGNIWVLHDSPLTPFEALQLDAEYLELVSRALQHANKAVRRVAQTVVQELHDDVQLSQRLLPSHLQALLQRAAIPGYPQPPGISETEESLSPFVRDYVPLSSTAEESASAAQHHPLRQPNSVRTVVNKRSVSMNHVPRAREPLALPERFIQLPVSQQNGARIAMSSLEPSLQQAVLDEWDARCESQTIRHPAGYLFGIIQKALSGEFHLFAAHQDPGAILKKPGT
ncbi:TPA: hypothetical protein L9M67_003831 [Klebsiella quasipneumoniae subsp. quasipneumoniae]|nr:hypothetical protein [Klebsiella quasipneumoniae subsp. quasipneumoniae]